MSCMAMDDPRVSESGAVHDYGCSFDMLHTPNFLLGISRNRVVLYSIIHSYSIILQSATVFTRLREERPEDLQKIVLIVGDIIAPNLGIKAQDEELLMEKVSVVIHSAATVRFNEPLKVALGINVEGTRKVLNLCHRMKTESLVNDLHGDIPTAIVRPSIGWVDNWYGATALLLAIGKGYCKTIIGDRNNVLDVIPVDYVSNAILVAAAKCQRYKIIPLRT
ncbi:Fatty acid reductase [Operophtera brumata]|uniref:Fatty acyl-CoA reductase n=1 Tax=Operophtera brumata TaxID=104452 RepID=A0A0L7LAX4_OPEBR|nr:Fatty acid reductase [Operophtera brumata]